MEATRRNNDRVIIVMALLTLLAGFFVQHVTLGVLMGWMVIYILNAIRVAVEHIAAKVSTNDH